ncbi:hypothetical protein DMENIID0001_022600 [Sergentomyia squamirostris]
MGDFSNVFSDSEKINITFHELSYSSKNSQKNKILNQLSGNFKSGRLCAVLGPSGAGKTSLLNIISGLRKPSAESLLLFNGKCVSNKYIRQKSSYLHQDICFLEKLTIRETLNYAAELKLPSHTLKDDKENIILKIVKSLSLDESLDTYVGKLSGGERKRVAIAEELITNPPIMILDEPTSGLDSVSTVQVITNLKGLAIAGRTVICVIHQPSSNVLDFFDDTYILSHGQCLYNGPIDGIIPHFQEAGYNCPKYYSRAEFVLEVASYQRTGNFEKLIVQAKDSNYGMIMSDRSTGSLSTLSIETVDLDSVITTEAGTSSLQQLDVFVPGSNIENSKRNIDDKFTYPLSQWRQFCILLHRTFLCNRRELIYTQLKLVMLLVFGSLIGLSFYNFGNDGSLTIFNGGLLYFLMVFTYTIHAMSIVLVYPLEFKLFHREYMNSWYAFLPYFYARFLAEIPAMLIGTFLTLIPAYLISDQPIETRRILLVCLIFVLLTINALFHGFCVGALCSIKMGIFILPATSLLMMIFSGFIIPMNAMPAFMKPISYITNFKYIFEGLMQAVYGYNRKNLECGGKFCLFASPSQVLDYLNMNNDNYYWDILGIIVWIVVLKLVFYIGLRMKVKC